MIRNIEYLDRPRLQPYEAVLTRLHLITGIDVQKYIKGDGKIFPSYKLDAQRVGTKVVLNPEQLVILGHIVEKFMQAPRVLRETGTPEAWLDEYLSGLDKRIQDLNESL
jgi:hypothetical protein